MNTVLRRNLTKNDKRKTAKAVTTYGGNLKALLKYNLLGIAKAKASVGSRNASYAGFFMSKNSKLKLRRFKAMKKTIFEEMGGTYTP